MKTLLPVHPPTAARLPHAPVRTAMLYLTEDCNLRCSYCFVHKKPRRMSAETAEKVVDLLLRRDLAPSGQPVQVNFFGGEPFLELERMEQLVEGCRRGRPDRRRPFQFSATTNGTLWSERIGRLLTESGMLVLLSLDGGTRATAADRPFVDGRSPHDLVAANLPRLREAAGDLVVRATFTPQGLDLVERVEALLDLGAPAVGLFPVLEFPWEACVDEVERAFERLAEWFLDHSTARSLPPLITTRKLLLQWDWHLRTGGRPSRPCQVGHGLIGLDTAGNVMPCHRFLDRPHDHLGDTDEPGLRSERRRPYLTLDSAGFTACESCPAASVCGGGCRASALQKGYRLDQVDPAHCVPMRAHHRAGVLIHRELERRGWLGALHRFPPSWSHELNHA